MDKTEAINGLLSSGSVLLPKGHSPEVDGLIDAATQQGYVLLISQEGKLISVTPKGDLQPVVVMLSDIAEETDASTGN